MPGVVLAACLLLFALMLVVHLVAGCARVSAVCVAACSLVTVLLASLWGLLRSRLARGGLADLFRGVDIPVRPVQGYGCRAVVNHCGGARR